MLKPDNRKILWTLAAITLIIWLLALAPAKRDLTVAVLDVGEGLCIVVNTPDGKTMLMDCGTSGRTPNTEIGVTTVVPYLTKRREPH